MSLWIQRSSQNAANRIRAIYVYVDGQIIVAGPVGSRAMDYSRSMGTDKLKWPTEKETEAKRERVRRRGYEPFRATSFSPQKDVDVQSSWTEHGPPKSSRYRVVSRSRRSGRVRRVRLTSREQFRLRNDVPRNPPRRSLEKPRVEKKKERRKADSCRCKHRGAPPWKVVLSAFREAGKGAGAFNW